MLYTSERRNIDALAMKQRTDILKIFCSLFLLLNFTPAHAGIQKSILIGNEEITAEVFGAGNATRVLWIAPSYGIHARHQQIAQLLGSSGLEVWQIDLPDSLFMPRTATSMRKISPHIVAGLIEHFGKNNKKVLLISSSYGAIPVLRGVQHWQSTQPSEWTVIGVVLFSPYLYTQVPPLGQSPLFIPVNTSVPIYIFQDEKNGNRWQFPAMLKHLQKTTTVYSEIMKGTTSLFYEKDTAIDTLNMLEAITDKIKQRMPLLEKYQYALTAPPVNPGKTLNLGLDAELESYKGNTKAQPFSLKDVTGKTYTRNNFTGKVTIINFWASWCPPCVEEIPSLNRLRKKMQGKKFELISINYAQTAPQIKDFMQKVAVDFPVLIDPEGKIAAKWNVVAFPSTFVIGPDGEIQYGVNAAIHWDTVEVINQLQKLIQ